MAFTAEKRNEDFKTAGKNNKQTKQKKNGDTPQLLLITLKPRDIYKMAADSDGEVVSSKDPLWN